MNGKKLYKRENVCYNDYDYGFNSEALLMDREITVIPPEEDEAGEDIKIARPPSAFRRTLDDVSAYLYGKKYLGFCFLIPAALLFLCYLARGVYPLGEGSVLVLDLNGQYVYFYDALRDIIKDGGSFVYTFRRALGGEFMGIFAYYLASPLSFLVALFPKENITEAIYFLLVLKCGLCGFTFGMFAHKTRPRHPFTTVTFSVMWALCTFAVVMQHNLMWTDNIFLFPLILLGIQNVVKRGKMSLYVVTLSLAILSNFYIGYMTCIFSGLYFFLYFFSKNRQERNPDGVSTHFAKSFLRFILASVCAVCIAACIILPTYYSLSLGKTDFSDPSFVPTLRYKFADLLSKFYFGSYDTVRPEGTPLLFTGTLTLIVAPLYFVCRKISIREKVVSAITAVIFVVSMNVSTLDLVWHGFQKPNWLNYRYAFMFCFFLVWWGMRAFEHIRETSFKWVIGTWALASAVIIALQKFGYDNLPDFRAVVPSLGILLVLLFIVRGVKSPSLKRETVARTALLFFVCAEMVASTLVNFNDLDEDVVISTRSGFRAFLDRTTIAAEELKEYDTSFYRTEKTFSRKTNDNMALGLYGLSGSTSTLNEHTIVFLRRMGYASRSHWSKYIGGNPVSDSLLAVKYLIAERDEVVNEATEVFDYPDDNMTTYRYNYALSIANAVSPKLTNAPFTDDGITTPFRRLNSLVSYMLGDPDAEGVFRAAGEPEITRVGVGESTIASHSKYTKYDADGVGEVNYNLTIDSSEPLYCFFPSRYTRDAELFLNDKSLGSYFESDSHTIVSLGRFAPGETIKVTLRLEKNELYVEKDVPYFWYLDTDRFEEAFGELSKFPLDVTYHTEDTIEGKITVPADRTQIFTSIPYDAGWRVTCDGEEVETAEVLDGLLTFTLTPGEHELSMKYKPESVTQGNIISIMGVIAFVLIAVSNKVLIDNAARRRAAEANSEECEALPEAEPDQDESETETETDNNTEEVEE